MISPEHERAIIAVLVRYATGIDARNWPLFRTCRSEEHTSELQSLMRIPYAVFCLKKTKYRFVRTLQTPANYSRSYTILTLQRFCTDHNNHQVTFNQLNQTHT